MAIFTIPNAFGIDVENQTLINHKCFCGALNHYFYKPVQCAHPFIFHVTLRAFYYPLHRVLLQLGQVFPLKVGYTFQIFHEVLF